LRIGRAQQRVAARAIDVLTMHAGAIRYAGEAETLPFSRQAKQSRTYKPIDALSARSSFR
jgi:hypothetical protein